MKRLLNTTTAISLAFATIPPLPSYAQTVVDINGQAVMCLASKADECPEGQLCIVAKKPENCEKFARQAVKAANKGLIPATGLVDLDAAKAALDAAQADAAAQAEADAAATAEADAAAKAAADAAAQADADAAAQADADAAAKAAAKAEKQAAKAAAQAEADAAAQAAADAAARAEADAAAQADADAAAQAAADAAAKADAAAQADADAAAQADADAAAKAAAKADKQAAKAAAQAEADAAAQAAADAAAADDAASRTAETDAAAAAAAEAAAQAALDAAATDEAADPANFPTITVNGQQVICLPSKAAVCPEGEFCVVAKIQDNCEANATKALAKAEPVATPVPTDDAVTGLDDAVDATATDPVVAAGDAPSTRDASTSADTKVTEEVITEEDVRASTEEFDAAPTVVAPGKKSGLSDLEKVGLIALGALVVGTIINNNKEVVSNSGDRVVVRQPDGTYVIYKDDDALLRQPGNTVRTETYRDGSTRTIVTRQDGSQVVTVRDATGRVLRRVAYDKQGREYVLINDMQAETPVVVSQLPRPTGGQITTSTMGADAELQLRLAALEAERLGRTFSLRQVREIAEVRALAATIAVDNITFDTGSAAIKATEAEKLTKIGALMTDLIRRNPNEIFLIEGHTDAVGSGASNLALSDRRAESVAKALTEYFDVPPENLVVQGYGETDLRVNTEGDERANRRAAVRIITPLLTVAQND